MARHGMAGHSIAFKSQSAYLAHHVELARGNNRDVERFAEQVHHFWEQDLVVRFVVRHWGCQAQIRTI